jgi:hypothetical protein
MNELLLALAPALALLPALIAGTDRRIVRRLRESDARDSSRAIPLSGIPLIFPLRRRRLLGAGAIREPVGGRYYLDEAGWTRYRAARRRRAVMIILALVGAILLALFTRVVELQARAVSRVGAPADTRPEGSMPTARLLALTDEARCAIDGEWLALRRFPFKVGRESRSAARRIASAVERRLGLAPQLNDLYIEESPLSQFMHISLEHFLIEYDAGRGRFFLTDRGSVCGTVVNGRMVGGNRAGGRIELPDRATIVIGTLASPFAFKFRLDV